MIVQAVGKCKGVKGNQQFLTCPKRAISVLRFLIVKVSNCKWMGYVVKMAITQKILLIFSKPLEGFSDALTLAVVTVISLETSIFKF